MCVLLLVARHKKSELISWNGCYHHKIGREERRRNVTQDKKLLTGGVEYRFAH